MSRLYDAAEPTVIDEKLLRTLILEQGPDGEAGKIIEKEGVEFHEVLELRIDFKSQSHDTIIAIGLLRLNRFPNIYRCTYTYTHNESILSMFPLDVQHIENLWQLQNLVKLRIDNNIIANITGLDQLVHLEWLGKKDHHYNYY